MTLRRQLFNSLAVLFIALFAASMTLSLLNARSHLNEQMITRAKDTALSLSLSLSRAITNNQTAMMESILDAYFDQRDYLSIIYRNNNGETILQRQQDADIEDVPAWFVRSLPLAEPIGKVDVTAGTKQLGSVTVVTNPGFVYLDLWATFRELLLLFGITGLITYALAGVALDLLLRPLRRVEEQAAAICERHFVEQTKLPRQRELRQVVEAINSMSRKLKSIFHEQLTLTENLRAQSHLDPVTGLSNRREFNARLQSITDSETGNGGCLAILQISDFGRYNLQHGHETGDECLRAVATQLQTLGAEIPDAIISRRAGADFALYLPRMNQERIKVLAPQLLARLASIDILYGHTIHLGIACCEVLRPDHRLLSEADLALRQSQSRGHSSWQIYQEGDVIQIAREARQWYATLSRVLQDRTLTFHYQPIFLKQETGKILATEIFCRITMQDKLVHAGIFLPMAERFSLAEAFDRLIIDEVRLRSEKHNNQTPLCINLSPQSISSTEFVAWLTGYLGEHQAFARQLVIETSEYLICTGTERVRMLCDMLHQHGARLSLDHFGIHSAAFGYLHSLPLDYLKIDRSFIRDIHIDTDNQFYVQSLVQIAHSCDITILAEGVEHEQEWHCLKNLGVDGGQGYFLARPAATMSITQQ
ncbi:MAG TPA: EAL domain-containing protein [Pseudomonadales bacterium]|nr:EAL domain-containing protein [Pseudomonadales bacterium]